MQTTVCQRGLLNSIEEVVIILLYDFALFIRCLQSNEDFSQLVLSIFTIFAKKSKLLKKFELKAND